MRIAIVHSFYSNAQPSGENTVVLAQTEALARAGHDVKLISRETEQESQRRLYRAQAMLSAANIAGPSPDSALSAFRPDVVHVHNLFPNWGTAWLRSWGKRTVATLHNYRPLCAGSTLWRDGSDCTECLDRGVTRALAHKCYRGSVIATLPLAWAARDRGSKSPVLAHSSSLIALNSQAQARYRQYAPRATIDVVPNFAAAAPEVPVTRDVDSPWIYVGRLVPEKGVDWLLDNWPDRLKLRIVGSGPMSERIEDRVRHRNNVEFLGRLSPDQTLRAIGEAQGLILPSLWSEGIPTVALEALASGTPLVVSDRCASAADLTAGRAGRVFRVDDGGEDLTRALQDIGNDADYRDRARDLYRENYSESAWLGRVSSIYERLMTTAPVRT